MQDAKQNRLGTAVDHMHFMTSWIVISTIVQLLFVTCILCIKWIFKKITDLGSDKLHMPRQEIML